MPGKQVSHSGIRWPRSRQAQVQGVALARLAAEER